MMALAPVIRDRKILRVWLALFLASASTYFVHDPVSYMAVDAAAAAIVMARPSSLPQKAIGALFTLMVMFDLGFYLSPHANWDMFVGALATVGWVQWLILGAWIGHDTWGRYRGWAGVGDSLSAAGRGAVQ